MNDADFDFIAKLLKKRSGLALNIDKLYLLESRLLPIARLCEKQTLAEFISFLRGAPNEKIITQVVDAMTTNESMFFRDKKPFDQIRSIVLPRLKEAYPRGGKIRIWSAACSNGQEPYSLAMLLTEEAPKLSGLSFEIIATDISERVLNKARAGIYSQFEVQRGLPITVLLKYFTQLSDSTWQINEKMRAMVNYRSQNLLENIQMLGTFDIILCRNVLIYFDDITKQSVLEKMSHMLTVHGVLMLGSTESVMGINTKYQPLANERGLYVNAA